MFNSLLRQRSPQSLHASLHILSNCHETFVATCSTCGIEPVDKMGARLARWLVLGLAGQNTSTTLPHDSIASSLGQQRYVAKSLCARSGHPTALEMFLLHDLSDGGQCSKVKVALVSTSS